MEKDWKKKGKFYYHPKTKEIVYMRKKYHVNKQVGWTVLWVGRDGKENVIRVAKTIPQATKIIKSYMRIS